MQFVFDILRAIDSVWLPLRDADWTPFAAAAGTWAVWWLIAAVSIGLAGYAWRWARARIDREAR